MRGWLRALSSSLSVRLFFWIALVLVSVCTVFAFQSFRNTSRLWTQSDAQSAHRTSALIKRSIHYGMLLNQKEDVHRTIRSIAQGPGVEGIRIYDKKGTIIFSADAKELGRRVDMKAEACVICHEQDRPLRSLPNRSRVRVFRDRGGHEILGLIQRESARCGDIVRDLLTFARQSKVVLASEPLSRLVGHAVALIHHQAERTGVVLEVLPHEGDDQVQCDGAQVQQAVLALLVNGIEAMPGGGRLTLSLLPAPDHVEIVVADTGPGISDHVLSHIFEPFFSTKSDEKGVGLGLAVVYGIVHRHGGRITVYSQAGSGATFRITLLRSPNVPAIQASAPHPATPPSGAARST